MQLPYVQFWRIVMFLQEMIFTALMRAIRLFRKKKRFSVEGSS